MTARASHPNRTVQRAEARARRLAVAGWRRRAATRQVCASLLRHPILRSATRVALYVAAGSELDVTPLINALHRRGCIVCLPRVRGVELHFHSYDPSHPLVRGPFGLLEPQGWAPRVPNHRLHAVVVPLVAFDDRGGRLGQGGGYYDRAFSSRRDRSLRSPRLIGAAFDAQRVSHVALEPWDVRIDAVAHDTLTRHTN